MHFTQKLALLIVLAYADAQAMPPTPNDASTISEMRSSVLPWKNSVVAMRGNVISVTHDGKAESQLFQIKVGPVPDSQTIWIAANYDQQFNPGDEVLVLGVATRTPSPDDSATLGSSMSRIVTDPFVVFAVCFLNLTGEWGGGQYKSACDEWWTERRIPSLETIKALERSDQ